MNSKLELKKILLESKTWTENQKSEMNTILNEIAGVYVDDRSLITIIEGLDQSDVIVLYTQAKKILKEK